MHMDASHNLHGLALPALSRRKFLFTALSLVSLAVVDPWTIARAADGDAGLNTFMQVSKLVSKETLDPVTGAALYQALRQSDQAFDANLNQLAKQMAATPGITIEALAEKLDNTKQAALRDTLNKVVSAWYLGVVGFQTYAYESALMFRVTDDVLSPPSYVRRGPLYWAKSTNLPSN
jgi:hypothetical protein